MRLFRVIPFVAVLFCAALPLRAELVEGILAVVNNAVITRQQVEDFAMPAIDSLRRQYAGDPDGFQLGLNAVITNSLELLTERQLILHAFDEQGYRMPDSYLDEVVQDRIRDRFGDRMALMKWLQAQGETFEQFRQDLRDQTIEGFMRQKNVNQEIIVSPFRIETYYHAHQDDFKVEDEIKLRMIALNKPSPDDTNTPALAREIRTQLQNGATFQQMASIYSQGSKSDYGWVQRSVLRQELADAAFALPVGQVSDVIDTPGACYLLLVEDKHPAHVRPLGEVRDDIEKTLRAQEQARLEKQWIESLKKKTFIRYF